MKSKLYVDKGEPLASCWPETLTDGSHAWNIYLRGGEVIHCLDEKRADQAFELLTAAVKVGTGENPLIL